MDEEELALKNLPLIYLAIKKMNIQWKSEDELQEYYSEGAVGLARAIKTFDPNLGIKKSTYFTKCIRNEIGHFLYTKTRKKRVNKYGTIPLDSNHECGVKIYEVIPDEKINIEEEIEKKIKLKTIRKIIKNIPNEKDKILLYMRYGFKDGKEYTFEQIGDVLGVSRTAANHRHTKVMKKLKKQLESEVIKW